MLNKYLSCFFVLFLCTSVITKGHAVPPSQLVCGKWESTDKNLAVQVYIENGKYQAKLIWFSNTGGRPMDYWKDVNNPDPHLRSRTLLGMSILNNLKYDPGTGTWEDGMVYDSRHGRTWNASAYINKNGELSVRGYWHFKFIGRTMTFYRI